MTICDKQLINCLGSDIRKRDFAWGTQNLSYILGESYLISVILSLPVSNCTLIHYCKDLVSTYTMHKQLMVSVAETSVF